MTKSAKLACGCVFLIASAGCNDGTANPDANGPIADGGPDVGISAVGGGTGAGGAGAGGSSVGAGAGGAGGMTGSVDGGGALQGQFVLTGSMAEPRDDHTATLLANGKVLLAGGEHAGVSCLTSAEIYDPGTGTFAATGAMAAIRCSGATATLLQNGTVLVVGGFYSVPLASAEIYDPVTGTFAKTGDPLAGRSFHTATSLSDGRVLIAGGETGGDSGASTPVASAEIYDPAAGSFSATGAMTMAREFHVAALLPSGKVLVAGTSAGTASAEIYDPATGTFAATGSLTVPRAGFTATSLLNGKVLAAGGQEAVGGDFLSSAELYDPSTGEFAATGTMTVVRADHTATLLANGQVLVTGGQDIGVLAEIHPSAELYDPATRTFTATGSLVVSRRYYAATGLADGRVLITGGQDVVTGESLASAELYR